MQFKKALLFLLFNVISSAAFAEATNAPAAAEPITTTASAAASDIDPRLLNYNLPVLLKMTMDILTQPQVRDLLRAEFKEQLKISPEVQAAHGLPQAQRELTESQLMELLLINRDFWRHINRYLADLKKYESAQSMPEEHREAWRQQFRSLFKEHNIYAQVQELVSSPIRTMKLYGKDGAPGYTNMQFFVNHSIQLNDKNRPPDDLKSLLIKFIRSAKKEIVLNVFDFDLIDVAEELLKKSQAGVKVRVGIDGPNVVDKRPAVKKVFDLLSGQPNIFVHAVRPVGLNHHKLVAIDWSLPKSAKVLMSSGNFTQSCIGPEGDAVGLGYIHPMSLPNANHMITVDSYILANLINHELSKTIDPGYQLRGKEYPLSGAYQIFGQGGNDFRQHPNMIITFTPGGGLGDVNRDIIANVIRRSTGPIRMVQFVTSSNTVEDALYNKFIANKEAGVIFDFASVGDTSFALRDFSSYMKMSGWGVSKDPSRPKYIPLAENRWEQAMSPADYKNFKKQLKAAPKAYGERSIRPRGRGPVKVSAKIHHKMLITNAGSQPLTITGSYNFSDSAASNQEYIVVIMEHAFYEFANAIYQSLAKQSQGSVEEVVRRRNMFRIQPIIPDAGTDAEDTVIEPAATVSN